MSAQLSDSSFGGDPLYSANNQASSSCCRTHGKGVHNTLTKCTFVCHSNNAPSARCLERLKRTYSCCGAPINTHTRKKTSKKNLFITLTSRTAWKSETSFVFGSWLMTP